LQGEDSVINERYFHEVKLYGMKSGYDEVYATAPKRKHEPQQVVGDLLRAEISEKQARSIRYQLTIAKLPLAKDVDAFTFKDTPMNEALVRDLAGGDYIAQQRNVVLIFFPYGLPFFPLVSSLGLATPLYGPDAKMTAFRCRLSLAHEHVFGGSVPTREQFQSFVRDVIELLMTTSLGSNSLINGTGNTCTHISSWLTQSQSLSIRTLFASGLKRSLRTAGRHLFPTFTQRGLTRASVLSTTPIDSIPAVLTCRLSSATPRLPPHCLARLWMKSLRSIARTFSCCNIRCGGINRRQF
jgi:hypothetical protein